MCILLPAFLNHTYTTHTTLKKARISSNFLIFGSMNCTQVGNITAEAVYTIMYNTGGMFRRCTDLMKTIWQECILGRNQAIQNEEDIATKILRNAEMGLLKPQNSDLDPEISQSRAAAIAALRYSPSTPLEYMNQIRRRKKMTHEDTVCEILPVLHQTVSKGCGG
ncbi:unnamed protein product [Caretta caretta]